MESQSRSRSHRGNIKGVPRRRDVSVSAVAGGADCAFAVRDGAPPDALQITAYTLRSDTPTRRRELPWLQGGQVGPNPVHRDSIGMAVILRGLGQAATSPTCTDIEA